MALYRAAWALVLLLPATVGIPAHGANSSAHSLIAPAAPFVGADADGQNVPVAISDGEEPRQTHGKAPASPAAPAAPVVEIEQADAFGGQSFAPPQGYDRLVMPARPHRKHGNVTEPVRVRVIVEPIQVTDIKGMQFNIDMHLVTSWSDSRLTFEPPQGQDGPVKVALTSPGPGGSWGIWVPELVFPSRTGQRDRENEIDSATLYSNGTVVRRQHVEVDLLAMLDLKAFPFDEHLLRVPIEESTQKAAFLSLVDGGVPEERIRRNPGWRIKVHSAQTVGYTYPCCPDEPWSRLLVMVRVQRRAGNVVITIVLPLMAIVITAYANFLIRELYDSRINLLVTLLLTLIALQLVIAEFLPQVDYFTWLHEFHAVCDVFVIVMLLASIAQFRTKDATHLMIARGLNFVATWVLPAVIVVTWVLFFTVFRGDSDLDGCLDPDTSALKDGC
jgi:hypothetical protein